MLRTFFAFPSLRRFTPLAVPSGFAAAWVIVLGTTPIPEVIDWRIVLLVVILGTAVTTLQTLPMVDPDLKEWGVGAGILGAMLAPFGASVTVLSLFSYAAGDLGPGLRESESVIPALVAQVIALMAVVAGLMMQKETRPEGAKRSGRWIVVGGTMAGVTTLAVHLILVANDVL